MANGAGQPWCSGRSAPPSTPAPTTDSEALRATSRATYGIPAEEIDAALARLVVTPTTQAPNHQTTDDLAPKRRRSGAPS